MKLISDWPLREAPSLSMDSKVEIEFPNVQECDATDAK
jgi:hypothetical protein